VRLVLCGPFYDRGRPSSSGLLLYCTCSSRPVAQFWPLGLDFLLRPKSTSTRVFTMVTPPAFGLDTVAIASAATGVAPAALATAISTVQATAVASCERVVAAAGATPIVHPHPLVGPPFLAVDASAPAGLAVGAARPLDAAVVVGALAGIAAGAAGPWAFDTAAGAPA
jgi:hypothetical protein